MVDISLKGRGPFTVFPPNAEAIEADRDSNGKVIIYFSIQMFFYTANVAKH